MINGAAQADVAILVVDSRRGEFETGFELGGQTREHALLLRSLGVSQLICAVNKMDTIEWSQERFEEIVRKLSSFLKSSGYKECDVTFVPVSGWTGENLITPNNPPLTWYNKEDNTSNTALNGIIVDATLIDLIDRLKLPERPISKPLRLCVTDVFRATGVGTGIISIAGRIDCGGIEVNDRVLLKPSNDQVTVKTIQIENTMFHQHLLVIMLYLIFKVLIQHVYLSVILFVILNLQYRVQQLFKPVLLYLIFQYQSYLVHQLYFILNRYKNKEK